MPEKAKSVNVTSEQIPDSDKAIYEEAKINPQRLDSLKIKAIIEGCISFGERLADVKLYRYQKAFAERVLLSVITNDGATIDSEFARQSGKTLVASLLIPPIEILLPLLAQGFIEKGIVTPITNFAKGVWCGVYGPDYERAGLIGNRVDDFLSNENSKAILSHPEIGMTFPERLSSYIHSLPRGSIVKVKSANRRVSIEGDTYHIVFTDETQEISDYVLKKSISPMLSSTAGTTVHLGSPCPHRVYFYDIIKQNKSHDTTVSLKKKLHFEADYREVQKYNKNYKKYIEKEKIKLGEQSDEFRMSYELYWPLEKGMFITQDFMEKNLGTNTYVSTNDRKNIHSIGIDIGKQRDSTVITVLEVDRDNPVVIDAEAGLFRHNKKIKNWFETTGDDYDAQYYMICEFIDNYKWDTLVIDSTGVGEVIKDRLMSRYGKYSDRKIIPFYFTRPDKSYGYQLLYRELICEVPRITYPSSEKAKRLQKQRKFVDQMTNLVKDYDGGYMIVHHSSDSGFDDYPDSLMLANFGAEEVIELEAEEFTENIYKSGFSQNRNTPKVENNFWRNRNER